MKNLQEQGEKRSLSEKILSLYVAGYLDNDLTGGNMIAVFDIVEHNPDGKTRLKRLIEEECMRKLSEEEIEDACKLLEDYK